MKSGRQDKVAGALDIVKGQVKKAAGALTGAEGRKAEGRKDQIKVRLNGGEAVRRRSSTNSKSQEIATY